MKIRKIGSALTLALFVAAAPAAMAKNHGKQKGHKGKAKTRTERSTTYNRAQFDRLFSQADRNGDGVISYAEWPSDASLFDRLDRNGDNVLTRTELQDAQNRYGRSPQEQLLRFDRNGDGVLTRSEFPGDAAAFDRLDRNRDGVLTGAEIGRIGYGYGDDLYRSEGNMRFRGMDRNGDGIITRSEWRGNDRSFDNHDWNRDGILSGSEVRSGGDDRD